MDISWLVRLISGVQARWEGAAPEAKQRIYFANHNSNLDFLLLWSVLTPEARQQTRPVAAADYWQANQIRRYVADHVFRALLIERKKVTKSNNPLELMSQSLEQGDSLIIFPEGGRNRSDDIEVAPFKSGLYHLSKRHPDLEMVPVYIHNMNRIMPAGELLVVPLICSITFGSPIMGREGEERSDFLQRSTESLLETGQL